ncbi:ammonium transporter [Chloroflexota bacterium]
MPEVEIAINTVWVMVAAFLVFFMQPGFAILEAGFTRAKNVANILMKNFMDFCMASIGFWAVGYAIMFGAGNFFVGSSYFFLSRIPDQTFGLPTLAFWFFQLAFAGAAATIVAGAMAERTKFSAYLIYSLIISAVIYPIVGHWVWGGGWLGELGFLDFAGSTVVHSVGGWASLMGAMFLGPRLGKYNKDGSANAITGHSLALAALGTFILWFGWFGFNPGSTLSGMDFSLIAKVAANTNLAAAAGAIVALSAAWIKTRKPDFGLTMNGALAGLVAITAPCAFVSPLSAIIIGAVGGLVMFGAVFLLEKIKIDDPVGAIPVHGFCGLWGTLSVGLFHQSAGLFFGGGWSQLGIQSIGAVAVFGWVILTMGALFFILKKTIGIRVSAREEMLGLDIGEHAVNAYPDFVTKG